MMKPLYLCIFSLFYNISLSYFLFMTFLCFVIQYFQHYFPPIFDNEYFISNCVTLSAYCLPSIKLSLFIFAMDSFLVLSLFYLLFTIFLYLEQYIRHIFHSGFPPRGYYIPNVSNQDVSSYIKKYSIYV